MSPPVKHQVDMKICRLCGINNKENIDIFCSKPVSSKSEDLLTKILTVYPMVLYKNDPLPQYICPRCIGNVSTTYQDIQQVLRQQNKWMNLTKAVHPEHKYFRVFNAVENSTDSTIRFIKSAYKVDISNITVRKLLAKPLIENHNTIINNTNEKLNHNESVVKNIKNKLESKGFTIKRVKVPTLNIDITPDINLYDDNLDEMSDDGDIVACNYCQQKFSNLKILAQHQLIHLKISANKVFQRRMLPKQSRRGRLITLNDTKCIRCLNCWHIFKDNKEILQHWCNGECEYYCSICGEEFPDSQQMLRDHVAAEHGVNHRSITQLFMKSPDKLVLTAKPIETSLNPLSQKIKSGYKKPPPKSCTKNDDGTITCKICFKVFDNFRSSNSHMRKHKPPAPRFDPMSLNSSYNTQDDFSEQPSTSNFHSDYNNPIMKPARPPYRMLMKNGPIPGVKTKIVQNRHDFLNNYPTNIQPSYQNSVTSTPDICDEEDVIVPEIIMPVIKSEPMLDGDDEYGCLPIKCEPLDNSDCSETDDEPRLCFICNEKFTNLRDYELHARFVHNIN